MKVRVRTAESHTIREYVVEAASRDDAWLHVHEHETELTPERVFTAAGGVYWAKVKG